MAAYTFELTATSAIGAIILGTFLALGKMAKSRVLSLLCSGYINLMRAVPLVLILFWFFFLRINMINQDCICMFNLIYIKFSQS